MKVYCKDNSIIIEDAQHFNAARSCNCGQAFRWHEQCDGSIFGVAHSRGITIRQKGDTVILENCDASDVDLWYDYFDLGRDYNAIEAKLLADPRLNVCVPYANGIRVFNQEPFEALISFIISANNNIKRISGIIEKICIYCGERREIKDGSGYYYCFPTPERLSALTVEELQKLGSGYRAPYILSTARRIAKGYDLKKLVGMDTATARKELLSFLGVGPKVADCILLFSLKHTDAFPIDVWMKRALRELFFENRDPSKAELASLMERLGEYSGIVQQYIFHYARESGLGKNV
ncbi:MAG: DNA glycosylase [Clostridia bacterium]|nr:DNA glycosylase [Clostridia bacterium]